MAESQYICQANCKNSGRHNPHSPQVVCHMPFLSQPSQFTTAWDRHGVLLVIAQWLWIRRGLLLRGKVYKARVWSCMLCRSETWSLKRNKKVSHLKQIMSAFVVDRVKIGEEEKNPWGWGKFILLCHCLTDTLQVCSWHWMALYVLMCR